MRHAMIVASLVGGCLAAPRAGAHGDVTPHPFDTTGLPVLGANWAPANPFRGNAKAIAIGAVGYAHNCAGCHGLNAVSGGIAPDLLQLANDCVGMSAQKDKEACLKDSDVYFKTSVLDGKKNSEGRFTMPSYAAVFSQESVWAIKAYLDQRTAEEAAKN